MRYDVAMTSLDSSLAAGFDNRPDPAALPSVSIAVLDDKGLTLKAFNSSTNTLFQAASISKPVAALTALRLVADDVIGLDDDINDHLKTWKVPAASGFEPRLTVRQLLSHTAGLTVHGFPGYAHDEPLPTLPQILDGLEPANTPAVRVDGIPGLTFRYSGGGYTVLQQLIEDVTAGPYTSLAEELVFKPCGMTNATFNQPSAGTAAVAHIGAQPTIGDWHRYPEQAAAGMWCTPTDLINFLTAIREAADGDTALLPTDLATEMLTPVVPGMGLGMFVFPDPAMDRFGHTGGNHGFGCAAVAARHGVHAAAIMTNGDDAAVFCRDTMDTIMDVTGWPHTPPPQRDGPAPWGDRYCGQYRLPSGEIVTVGQTETGTSAFFAPRHLSVPGQNRLPLEAIDERLCRVLPLRADVIFDLTDDGTVLGLTIRQRGQEVSAERLG